MQYKCPSMRIHLSLRSKHLQYAYKCHRDECCKLKYSIFPSKRQSELVSRGKALKLQQ